MFVVKATGGRDTIVRVVLSTTGMLLPDLLGSIDGSAYGAACAPGVQRLVVPANIQGCCKRQWLHVCGSAYA